MGINYSLTGFSDSTSKDKWIENEELTGAFGFPILNWVCYSIAGVCAFFLFAFAFDESMSVSWFFISELIALLLIPALSRQGFKTTAKFLLILYVNIAIVILSSIFDNQAEIQYFLIPTMGLAILLFDYNDDIIRNISIFLSAVSFFIIDFIAIDTITLSSESIDYVRWGVISAAFVTTWIIFNTFYETKERAEKVIREYLEKEKELNVELSSKQDELEKYITELEETKEELVKSSSAKSDFLATMSHEIRTPMNAILGMTHLLKEDNPRDDQLDSINVLDFSGKTLLALIDDILDFSKIGAGKIEFENTTFELEKLVATITETFRVTAQNKKVDLETEIGNKVPKYLIGDPARLTQILNNLMSNALKFTEKGSVKLLVRSVKERQKSNEVEFSVVDTGIGIEEERMESIFESFVQAGKETKRLYGGTGLGLTISKQLVELQGGKLSVESRVGKGSTFKAVLSFDKVSGHEQHSPAGIIQEEQDDLSGIKVLIAEDNIVNQKVIESFLKRWNVKFDLVNNGDEAIEKLKIVEDYDMILMDLEMPLKDGYEATKEIRIMKEPDKRNIPIIALTAAALTEVKEKVKEVGMNDFVTKPFNPVELRKKLKELSGK